MWKSREAHAPKNDLWWHGWGSPGAVGPQRRGDSSGSGVVGKDVQVEAPLIGPESCAASVSAGEEGGCSGGFPSRKDTKTMKIRVGG